jgi:predicted Zn-dependent protease
MTAGVSVRVSSLGVAALLGLAMLGSACATNPVTGRREFTLMSEAQEIALGKDSDTQIRQEMGVYDAPDLQRYVNDVGQRLAKLSQRPSLPWQFTVVDQPAINAFALPGGFIYLTRGILPFLDDEAELAGVLGHEIGHVTARHSAQQYTRTIGGQVGLVALGVFVPAARPFGQASEQAMALMFLKFGRDDELQSDELGATYAAAGGWDPAGVSGMLSTLGRLAEASGDRKGVPNFLSTHPDPLARVSEVAPTIAKLRAGGGSFQTGRDRFVDRLAGLIYGDNPEQGIFRGQTFLHPPLRFRLEFPDKWATANSTRQVMAQAPTGDGFLLLQVVEQPTGSTIQDVALASMRQAGLELARGDRTSIGGFDAYLGTYQGQIEGLGPVTSRAGHLRYGDKVYIIAGLAPPAAFEQHVGVFDASIRTFRSLSAAEAEAIRPARIELYTARAGDTWQALAGRSGGAITATALAAMNHTEASQAPRAGTRLKVVVAG